MNPNNISHISPSYTDMARGPDAERKRFVAKGHDSQLQEAQYDKSPVEIVTLAGETHSGKITRRDRYTITLALESGINSGRSLMLFKHAIESVMVLKRQEA